MNTEFLKELKTGGMEAINPKTRKFNLTFLIGVAVVATINAFLILYDLYAIIDSFSLMRWAGFFRVLFRVIIPMLTCMAVSVIVILSLINLIADGKFGFYVCAGAITVQVIIGLITYFLASSYFYGSFLIYFPLILFAGLCGTMFSIKNGRNAFQILLKK